MTVIGPLWGIVLQNLLITVLKCPSKCILRILKLVVLDIEYRLRDRWGQMIIGKAVRPSASRGRR